MSFPVVLKVVGSLHKSDAGGVVLGLPDATAAEDAYLDLVARLAPPAVSVEVMADLDGGVELIVGCLRDPRFGPVVMVGLGGVFAEVLGDTAVALAPVSSDGARTLLTSLRGAPLLDGARGRAPVDLDALADLVARVSARRRGPSGARRARGQPGAGDARRGARPRRARRTRRVGSGLDVAPVALVERVDPGVLRREDAVVERA